MAAESTIRTPVRTKLLTHRLWIEGPRALRGVPRWAIFFGLSALIYGLAALLSLALGISQDYFGSIAFIVGAIGIAWAMSSIGFRTRGVDRLYGELPPAFSSPEGMILEGLRRRFKWACSTPAHILTGSGVTALFLVAAIYSFFDPSVTLFGASFPSLRPTWFDAGLYTPEHRVAGFLLVSVFGAGIGMVIGAAGWLIASELRVVAFLGRLAVPPLPEALRVQLRRVANFHVAVARDWSLGALLFAAMFAQTPDAFSITLVATLALLGAITFVYPQVVFRGLVIRAHDRAAAIAVADWQEFVATPADRSGTSVGRLADLATLMTPPGYWVYGAGNIAMWAVAQATALAALYFQVRAL